MDRLIVRRTSRVVLGLALLSLALLTTGCDENDVVFLRVVLEDDLSGTLTTCGLSIPDGDGAPDFGVSWQTRARLECASGRFRSVGDLKVDDVRFSGGRMDDGFGYLQVTLPRGESARWIRRFVPTSEASRRAALDALDPKGRAAKVGTFIKLIVEVPGSLVSQGLEPIVPGVEEKREKNVASVVFPLKRLLENGDPLVCHLTFRP